MAISVLMIYEPIDSTRDKQNYWKSYVSFYEKYWDGPATPQSSWFGQEYENFRKSLSEQLGIDKKEIQDCFFMKDEEENCYVTPIAASQTNVNIFSSANFIPFEWFLMYEGNQKKYFYTHTGFGAIQHDAIYYNARIEQAIRNLKDSLELIEKSLKKSDGVSTNSVLKHTFSKISEGIEVLLGWLSGFDLRSFILLNYGEICAHIEPESMKNEDSVSEIKQALMMSAEGNTEYAHRSLKILISKWEEIKMAATSNATKTPSTVQ